MVMKKTNNIFLISLLFLTSIIITVFLFGFKKKELVQTPKFEIEVILDTMGYTNNVDTIDFKITQKLNWIDFKAAPPTQLNNSEVANSSLGFAFASSIVSDNKLTKVKITIKSFFIRNKSWVLPKNKTDYILNHEYNHFIIARYGAEMFRKNILHAKLNRQNISTELSKIFKSSWSDYRLLQSKYDKETNHSINKQKQKNWDEILEKKKFEFVQ
jgi:hypothetical protein